MRLSSLYYSALCRLDASIGHMLYSFYPLFVAIWLLLDHQPVTKLTALRLILSIPAVILLLQTSSGAIDLLGAVMMIGSAILYALHLLINQRILYEAPAPTVTLYTLLGMAATVILASSLNIGGQPATLPPAWRSVCSWWESAALRSKSAFQKVGYPGLTRQKSPRPVSTGRVSLSFPFLFLQIEDWF